MFLLAESSATLPEELWRLATPLNVMWYVYALAGIGFYGGYEFWGFLGRALYWVVFPIHAALITVFFITWGFVRLSVADIRYISVPAVFVGFVLLACLMMGPVGVVPGVPIGIWLAYQASKRGHGT